MIQHGDSSVTDPASAQLAIVSSPSESPEEEAQGPKVASPLNNDKEQQEAIEAWLESMMERKIHSIVETAIMSNRGQPDQHQRPTRTFPSTAIKWAAAMAGPNSEGPVKWAEKKVQRAHDHAVRTKSSSSTSWHQGTQPTLSVITHTPFCEGCHKGPPGKYCTFRRCTNCCRTHRGSEVCQHPCHTSG